jgi:hypothetical protein
MPTTDWMGRGTRTGTAAPWVSWEFDENVGEQTTVVGADVWSETVTANICLEVKQDKADCCCRSAGHAGMWGYENVSTSILNLGARQGWVISLTPRPLYSRRKSLRCPLNARPVGTYVLREPTAAGEPVSIVALTVQNLRVLLPQGQFILVWSPLPSRSSTCLSFCEGSHVIWDRRRWFVGSQKESRKFQIKKRVLKILWIHSFTLSRDAMFF